MKHHVNEDEWGTMLSEALDKLLLNGNTTGSPSVDPSSMIQSTEVFTASTTHT